MVQTLFRFTPWFRPCSRLLGLTRTSNVVFADTVHAMVEKFKVGLNQYEKLIRSRQVTIADGEGAASRVRNDGKPTSGFYLVQYVRAV